MTPQLPTSVTSMPIEPDVLERLMTELPELRDAAEWDESLHPRDEQGQFTDKGDATSDGGETAFFQENRALMTEWANGQPGFEKMRSARTTEGKQFLAALSKLPDFRGKLYRGTSITHAEFQRMRDGKDFTMKLSSSASKKESIVEPFLDASAMSGPDYVTVLLEMDVVHGKDISTHVPDEWQFQEEVVIPAGSKFWRVGGIQKESINYGPYRLEYYRVGLKQDPRVKPI